MQTPTRKNALTRGAVCIGSLAALSLAQDTAPIAVVMTPEHSGNWDVPAETCGTGACMEAPEGRLFAGE